MRKARIISLPVAVFRAIIRQQSTKSQLPEQQHPKEQMIQILRKSVTKMVDGTEHCCRHACGNDTMLESMRGTCEKPYRQIHEEV